MVFNVTFNKIPVILWWSVLLTEETVISTTNIGVGLGLWCLISLSTRFQIYRGGQFYWQRKPKYPEKTAADLLQVTDKNSYVLWCLTPLSTKFQLYCGSQFY